MTFRDILRFVIVAAMFATPFLCLYVAGSMFFPFITGKNFAFRILVEGMFGVWALLAFMDKTYRPRFSWILAAAGAFLIILTIADFTGVNPSRSFWSNYERMEGLITIAHLFLYFIIAGTVLQGEKIWLWFWRTSLGVSLIVATHAFSQFLGRSEIHQSSTRLDASFGNSAYLAVYALSHAFLAVFLFVRDRKSGFRFVYPVVAVVNIVVLYLTQTRGALLGLIGGSFLAMLFIVFFGKEHKKLRTYAVSSLVAILIAVGLFIQFRDASWIRKSPTLERLATISLSDPTTISRFMIWQMSYEGFKERPLLGWGQDNFLYVFSKYYNPKMWNQEPWFDRSHNVFFDWLVAGGALGLLAYLSMFGAVLYYLWFRNKNHFSVVERSIITGMLAGYFIHNIFVFDNLTSYIVFFGFLAYLHATYKEEKGVVAEKSAKKERDKNAELEMGDYAILGILVVALTAGMIYFVNVRNIRANVDLINAIRPEGIIVDDGQGGQKIALEDILDRGLFGTREAREQLAQLAVMTLDPSVPQPVKEKFFNLTANQFEEDIAKDPDNLRTRSFAALFYARFGQYGKALEHFQKAIELSPKRQPVYVDLAMTYVIMGKYDDAEKTAKIAYDLESANPEARITYAVALIYAKKADVVGEIMSGYENQPGSYDHRILNAYGANGYYREVVALANEKIARGFANGRDYFILAGGLAQLGERKAAIAVAEKAISLDESLKDQGEQLIKEIRR